MWDIFLDEHDVQRTHAYMCRYARVFIYMCDMSLGVHTMVILHSHIFLIHI